MHRADVVARQLVKDSHFELAVDELAHLPEQAHDRCPAACADGYRRLYEGAAACARGARAGTRRRQHAARLTQELAPGIRQRNMALVMAPESTVTGYARTRAHTHTCTRTRHATRDTRHATRDTTSRQARRRRIGRGRRACCGTGAGVAPTKESDDTARHSSPGSCAHARRTRASCAACSLAATTMPADSTNFKGLRPNPSTNFEL